jgi:hypothetical protein
VPSGIYVSCLCNFFFGIGFWIRRRIVDEDQRKEALEAVLEINRMIVKQNALIVQTLTLPKLMVSGERRGAWKEYPSE